jgi:DHA1 family tetracycline resistance protein-like MFS transporter
LIAGLIGGVVSYLWLARAASVEELGAARLFGGLMAGNVGAAFAAAADLADDKTRARNMGFLGAAVGLGFIAGPALGALLIGAEEGRQSFAFVCYVSAALAGLAALAAFVLFRESLPPEARRQVGEPRVSRMALLTSRPTLTRFVLIMFLVIAAQAMMETVFGLWAAAQSAGRWRDWALARCCCKAAAPDAWRVCSENGRPCSSDWRSSPRVLAAWAWRAMRRRWSRR